MRPRKGLWICGCATLAACAQLGGFEDFHEGSANGGTSTGATAGASAAKGGASSEGGAGRAASSSGSAAVLGGAGSEALGDAGSGELGGAPTQAGKGGSATGGGGGSGGGTGLLANCVLLLHFEETSWSMKAGEVRDSSGLGNHGTAATNTLTTSKAGLGKFGRAGQFDGSGGVVVPDAPSLRPSDALTVAAWIYPTAIDLNGSGIVNKRRGYNSDTAFSMFVWRDADPDSHLFADVQGEESRFHSLALFDVNKWWHVALVFDGNAPSSSRSSLYVNGQLDATSRDASVQIEPYTSDVVIGDLVGGGARFTGMIDEVAIWTRALSAQEVHDVFAAQGPL